MPKEIPSGAVPASKAVLAAGAVLWRSNGDSASPEVAIIHRPRYDDWSLPKGKVDPGETEPVTAVREVQEETGYTAALGRRLAGVSYPVEQGIKKVRYWAARRIDGDFSPNAEVDALVWLPVADALDKLGYPHDRKVLRRFDKYPVDTQTVLIVRHGTAGSKSRYRGDDRKRPLDKHGRAQAESLVGQLLAFGAGELYAADRVSPDARTVGRGIGSEHPQRAGVDRGGLFRRSQARPATRP